jgi:multicomponent K+:H+ antiporter subunit G
MSELLTALLLLIGAGFVMVGAIGLVRLPDFFARLHAPTKASTLGIGAMLLASSLHFSLRDGAPSLHELLILLFLFITAPISAHLLCKAGLQLNPRIDLADSRSAEQGGVSADAE